MKGFIIPVGIMSGLLFIAGSSSLIYYGEEIRKNKSINEDQSILILLIGILMLIYSIGILAYSGFKIVKGKGKSAVKHAPIILISLFFIASASTLIYYGDKLKKLHKTSDDKPKPDDKPILNDKKAGEFMIAAGSICLVVSLGVTGMTMKDAFSS